MDTCTSGNVAAKVAAPQGATTPRKAHLSGVILVEPLFDGDLAQGFRQVALYHCPDFERNIGLVEHHLKSALEASTVPKDVLRSFLCIS